MKKIFFQNGVGLLAILSFLLIGNAVRVKAADCPGGICVQTIPGTTAGSVSSLSGYRIVSDPTSCGACRSGETALNQLSQENGIPITAVGKGTGNIPRIEDPQGKNLGEGVKAIQNKVAELTNNIKTPGGGTTPKTKKCIVLTPGPSKEYGDFVGTNADDWITVFDSPVNCLSMGILFPKFEDPLNTKLRLAKKLPLFDYDWSSAAGCAIYYTDAQKSISALSLAKKSAGNEIAKIHIPTRADAEFYIANGLRGWKVPGDATMEPSIYLAGSKTAKDITGNNVKIGEDCSFTKMTDKEIQDLKDQNQGGNQEPFGGLGNNGSGGGSGGGGNGGGGLGGGLSGKLGQLLQGLLGGLGQGGNQNGQASPTPTPFVCPTTSNYVCGSDNKTYVNRCYAEFQGQVSVKHEGACNNSDTGNTVCSSAWQPVCGNDSKTYSNTCELKKVSGVTVAKQGVCADNASTGNISTLSALLKQATQSGVPSSVLESAIRTVTNLITSMLSNGTKNPSEVIVP